MIRRLRSIFAIALVVAAWVAPCAGAEHRTEARVGVLAVMEPGAAEAAWRPTLDDLNAPLPEYHFTMVKGSISFLTAAVAAHRLDFLITNPGHCFELRIDYSATAFASEQNLDGPPANRSVGSTIIALSRKSDLQRLDSLRGRKLAAIAPDTFGFRAAALELVERGLVPFQDVVLVFVGYPVMAVLGAVREGRADAGIIRSCALEKLIADHKIGLNEFKVVGQRPDEAFICKVSTRLYPGWAFVKVAQTPEPLAEAVAHALLVMQPGTGDRFWTAPDDYQSVQDLYHPRAAADDSHRSPADRGSHAQSASECRRGGGRPARQKGQARCRAERLVDRRQRDRQRPGLAPEARKRLLEAFYTTKPSSLGLGLRLSLSRSIIELHGGRLSADDRAGQRTMFRFQLPIIMLMEHELPPSRAQERRDV